MSGAEAESAGKDHQDEDETSEFPPPLREVILFFPLYLSWIPPHVVLYGYIWESLMMYDWQEAEDRRENVAEAAVHITTAHIYQVTEVRTAFTFLLTHHYQPKANTRERKCSLLELSDIRSKTATQ